MPVAFALTLTCTEFWVFFGRCVFVATEDVSVDERQISTK